MLNKTTIHNLLRIYKFFYFLPRKILLFPLFLMYKLTYWTNYKLYNKIFIQFVIGKSSFFLDYKNVNSTTDISNNKHIINQPQKNNIMFCIHWFNLGGAESYALFMMEQAKYLGHTVHAISMYCEIKHDIDKFKKTSDYLVEIDTLLNSQRLNFLCNYINKYKINIIHIHHLDFLYKNLSLIKNLFPHIKIIDSLHIVEYASKYWRQKGGFVRQSIQNYKFIDVHNVISKNLEDYMRAQLHKIDKTYTPNILNKYLCTIESSYDNSSISPKIFPKSNIQLLFYARFNNQKQVNLFIEIIKHLNTTQNKHKFQGVIVGAGEMKNNISKIAKADSNIILHDRIDNKDDVFKLAQILLITSLNEGLTLTSFEAIKRNTVVISTNVGAQRELIPEIGLVDILDENIIESFSRIILKCVQNKDFYHELLQQERNNLQLIIQNSITLKDCQDLYSV